MPKSKHSIDFADVPNKYFPITFNKPRNLKDDMLSGITVALALVPEAIAFAFVVGINPQVGLYAAFMMGLITAIFGGRPGMISGATGAVAVIFAPLVAEVMQRGTESGLSFELSMASSLGHLFSAVILMGIIQMACGFLKLGKFIRLVPHPVMLGFVNGLAIIIFMSQFEQFMVGGQLLDHARLLIMVVLIAITMGICILLPKITKAVPASLVAIISITGIGYLINRTHPGSVLTVLDFVQGHDPNIQSLSFGFPSFALPQVPLNLDVLTMIFPYAALAAAVGLIESLMTLTLVDELTETRGRGNRECIGQGFANVVNGFFGGMGGCAMIGQSMINIRGGGRGRTSGITAAIVLIVLVMFGSSIIEIIPLAALVGIMFMVVIGTFEWSSLRLLGKVPLSDIFIIVLVSVTTVVYDLAIAVFVGIIVSSLVFAWEHGKSIMSVKREEEGRTVYALSGPLFFGSITSFKNLFDFQNDQEHVVIDFDDSRIWDHSGIEALQNITERYGKYDKKLHLLNLSKDCQLLLRKAENIVELSVIQHSESHIADDLLD